MDILTHGLTGVLTARAAARDFGKAAFAASMLGALGPDLDLLAVVGDPLASLTVHRLATHSLAGGSALVLVVGGLVRLVAGGSLWSLIGLASLGWLSHALLDFFTPSGIPLLWPLDGRRWTAGSIHLVDPAVTALTAIGLLGAWGWRPGWRSARAGVLALVGYLVVSVTVMKGVEAWWARALGARGVSVSRLAVVPAFPGPFRWRGVAEGPSGIVLARFWVWDMNASGATLLEPEPEEPGLAQLDNHPAVRSFLSLARFPWRRTVQDGGGVVVEYHELAFEDHPFGGPKVLRLRLSRSGAVEAVEWEHRL
jgi:membrane-bound metal-dependent hydrolase YbcI (DUF457 family)